MPITLRRAAVSAAVTITALLGAATVAGSGAPAASAATTSDQLAGKRYVALGDSYAAGFGLPPYAATPAPGCLQSSDNTAHRIARTYGLELTDVSCTGATIANVLMTPQAVPGGSVPVQLDALTPDTALVTVTIGGNDAGFTNVLSTCAAASAAGPLLMDPAYATCAAKYGSQVANGIQAVVKPALDAMLAAIHQKAPGARVIFLGYPALAPTDASTPASGCFSSALGTGRPPFPQNAFPFTDANRTYIASLSAQLDAVQRASAASGGATFLSALGATDTHSPCAGTAQPYLNGISLLSLAPPALADGAMHPNAAGASFLTAQLAAAIDHAFPATAGTPLPGGTAPPAPATDTAGASTAATGPTAELAATGRDNGAGIALGLLTILAGSLALMARRRQPAS